MNILRIHPSLQVLSLLHPPVGRNPIRSEIGHLEEGERKIRRIIRQVSRASGPGTLFIEGDGKEEVGQEVMNPYFSAIREARRLGWRVVGLDGISRLGFFKAPHKPTQRQRYVMFDVRENDWVEVLAHTPQQGVSLAAMHPNHVQGFLEKGKVPAERVQWIHAAPSPFSIQRLSPEEVGRFLTSEREGRRRT